jgi:hypothetical protein
MSAGPARPPAPSADPRPVLVVTVTTTPEAPVG